VGESWTFDRPDRFTCGCVGEPGQRTFYLQVRDGRSLFTLQVEKEQVRVLGQYLGQVAQQLGGVEPDRDVVGLAEPLDPTFVVGDVGVAADDDDRAVVIVLEELPWWPEDEDDDERGRTVTVTVPLDQAAAFAEVAEELVRAGRPPCPLCGAPVDPGGHACPRWN
jgi:uncharacterized repeat protein (TIGR03847 family)